MSKVNGAKYHATPQSLVERVLVAPYDTNEDGCHLWKGSTGRGGYGYVTYYPTPGKQVTVLVHRLVYVRLAEDPGDEMQIDHACHDPLVCVASPMECPHRRCYNLDHLEAVTQPENSRRSGSVYGRNARKEVCDHGHELAGDNLFTLADGGRGCRECQRRLGRESRERDRDKINARNRAKAQTARLTREHRCQICGADIHHRPPHAKFCELCTTDKPTRGKALRAATAKSRALTEGARQKRRKFLSARPEPAADRERRCRKCGADISHRAAQARFCEQCRPVKEAA